MRVSDGQLTVATGLALQNSTINMQAGDSGTLVFNQSSTIGGLRGARALDLNGQTVSIGNNNASATYSGVLSNGSLTKVGTGTLTLSNANAYSGSTTIRGGVLALTASGSFANSGTIVVGDAGSSDAVLDVSENVLTNFSFSFGAAQVLKGKGTVRGASASGDAVVLSGLLSPGNSPGMLTFADIDLTLASTANTLMEITGTAAGTQYDVVRLTGDGVMTYGGTLTLDMSQAFATDTKFNLFSFTSGISSGTFATVVSTGAFYSGTFTKTGSVFRLISGTQTLEFRPNVADTGVSYGQLVIVPEPLTLGLLGVCSGVAVLCVRRYRRRRAAGGRGRVAA